MAIKLSRFVRIIVSDQSGIVIYMVTTPANEMLKNASTFRWDSLVPLGGTTEMIFSDVMSIISSLVQEIGKRQLICGERQTVLCNNGLTRVLTGKQASPVSGT